MNQGRRLTDALPVAVAFEFEPHVSLTDAEMSLHLAMFAAEGLFGRAQVRLDTDYELDEPQHRIVVDAESEVGAVLVRVFTALLLREFGEDSFRIRRGTAIERPAQQTERTVPA